MADLIALARPAQWIKNFFVLGPLVFSQRMLEPDAVASAGFAFTAFCLAASASYVVNDVVDRNRDRWHPIKSARPVADGRISIAGALALAAALGATSLVLGAVVGSRFVVVLLGFLGLQTLYSLVLKSFVIVDVATIAAAFVLRAAGGVVAIDARMSPWLFLCTFLVAVFLALGKRRHEITYLKGEAGGHREVLGRYTVGLLDLLIAVAAMTTIVVYTIYTVWPSVELKLGTARLYYTVPFVVFGVFRYLFLIYGREEGGSPTDLLLGDVPLQTGIALWIVTVVSLLYT